jgi:hypothetical protein
MGIAKFLASGDIMRTTLPTFGNAGKKNCGDANLWRKRNGQVYALLCN